MGPICGYATGTCAQRLPNLLALSSTRRGLD
jgi:hypothetical protein